MKHLLDSSPRHGDWQEILLPTGLRAPAWAKAARVDWHDECDNDPVVEVTADIEAARDDHFYDVMTPDGIENMASTCHYLRGYHAASVRGEGRWHWRRHHKVGLHVTDGMFTAICADLLSHLRLVRVWSHCRWTIQPIKPEWHAPKRAMRRSSILIERGV